MEIHTIKTAEDYEKAMQLIDTLLDSVPDTKEAETLELVSILVEDYENKHYKIDIPDPIEAVKQRAEQLGLSRKDLEKTIGSRARVSEVLNRKRALTLPMIRRINKNLNIPAEVLIQEFKKKTA